MSFLVLSGCNTQGNKIRAAGRARKLAYLKTSRGGRGPRPCANGDRRHDGAGRSSVRRCGRCSELGLGRNAEARFRRLAYGGWRNPRRAQLVGGADGGGGASGGGRRRRRRRCRRRRSGFRETRRKRSGVAFWGKSHAATSLFFKIFRSLELESSFFSDPDGTISFLSPWHLLMCANRYLVCPGDSFS